jgi:hypothetical protein
MVIGLTGIMIDVSAFVVVCRLIGGLILTHISQHRLFFVIVRGVAQDNPDSPHTSSAKGFRENS